MTATSIPVPQLETSHHWIRVVAVVAAIIIALAIAFAVGRATSTATHIVRVDAPTQVTTPAKSFACPRAGIC